MSSPVTVRCKRPYDLDEDSFARFSDQFRNGLLLPPEAFDELGISNYDYVRVQNASARERTIRTVATKLRSDPELRDGDSYVGTLRTKLYKQITTPDDGEDGIELLVRPDRSGARYAGTVGRTYDDDVDHRVCHIAETRMNELGISVGDTAEIFNPETGGRIGITVGEPHSYADLIRVDVRSRQAINVEPGDRIGVRDVEAASGEAGVVRRLQKVFIGSRELPFHVKLGPDQDEYRNVVRMTEDMMEFLGIEPGDNVVLRGRGKTTKSQCLSTQLADEAPPNTIKIPSTERDRIDISVHDAVRVERDMWYVFREQLSTSVFGIMGVIVGFLQVVLIINLAEMTRRFGVVPVTVGLLTAVVAVSVFVIWLLMTPERQKCVSHD